MTSGHSILLNVRLLASALLRRFGRAQLRRGFDRAFYLERYPDVRHSRLPGFLHYLLFGYREFRDPSAAFSTAYYLRRNPDVFQSQVCPLLHYACFGRLEGRPSAPAEPPSAQPCGQGPPPAPWPPDRPLVSVVVPCFNYGRFLAEALESIEAQSFRDLEILVIEGGSTDPAGAEEVRKLERSARRSARFFYREAAARVGDNRNFGIARARGKYICCLDADDRMLPGFLEVAVFIAECGDYDIVSPSLRCFGQRTDAWHASTASTVELSRENTLTSASLFRREVWEAVGGFRDFGVGAGHVPEDWDFWLRAVASGYLATAIPAPLYEYRVHSGSLSAGADPSSYAVRIAEANAATFRKAVAPRVRIPPVDGAANLNRLAETSARPGVLLCLPWVTNGGAEKLLCSLFGRFAKQGLPVAAVTTSHLKPLMADEAASFERAGIPVYPLAELLPNTDLWHAFLCQLIRRLRVRHLFLCGSEYAYTQLASLRSAFPGLHVIDQLFNEEGHLAGNRRAASSIDLTLVPSQALRSLLLEAHGESPDRVKIIRHGLLPAGEGFSRGPALPWERSDRFVVAFAGRLAPEKDPVFFVELAARLAASDRFAFVLLGDGPERPKVESAIRRHGLQGRFFFPGAVLDARSYLRVSGVVVVPSRVDGMPNVVLEAMTEGIPVVASRVGGIPEMVVDEQTGLLCQAGNMEEFEVAVRRLAGAHQLRKEFSANARRRVVSDFSFEATVSAYRRQLGLD